MKIIMENIALSLQDKVILQDIHFTCETGKCIGIIGPNGAGKTSLLKILAGLIPPEKGYVFFKPEINQSPFPSALQNIKNSPLQTPCMLNQPVVHTGLWPFRKKTNRRWAKKKTQQKNMETGVQACKDRKEEKRQQTVLVDDKAVLNHRWRARLCSYLPQNPHVYWPLSVKHVVVLGRTPYIQPGFSCLSEQDQNAIEQALQKTDLLAFAERGFHTLSGGEQARVHLARILAAETPFVFLDEPVNGLDPACQSRVLTMLTEQKEKGIVLILHDLVLAAHFCDRLILLDQGRCVANAPSQELSSDLIEEVYHIRSVKTRYGFLRYEHCEAE